MNGQELKDTIAAFRTGNTEIYAQSIGGTPSGMSGPVLGLSVYGAPTEDRQPAAAAPMNVAQLGLN